MDWGKIYVTFLGLAMSAGGVFSITCGVYFILIGLKVIK